MRQFCEILLDGVSILPIVKALRIDRRNDQAVDALTLELADYSLYSEFDFGSLPAAPRVQVATAAGDPKSDGATLGAGVLTSASSNFVTQDVTTNDLLLILASSVRGDIGAWPITNIAATQLTSSHTFGSATGIQFIVLTGQGRFYIEKPDVAEDKNSLTIPSLWGRSALAVLVDPFAPKISRTWKVATSFYEVCRDLVRDAGMDETKIVFDIDDYVIPQDILSVTGQYPLQIISDLAGKTNGYVRNTKGGDLWIKRERFHFGALPVAQALGDGDVQETRTRIEYPEFGNRILIRSSVASATQPIRVTIKAPESCLRGDGRAHMDVEAIVVDNDGKPVADGTAVDWTIDNAALAVFLPPRTQTTQKVIISEPQRSDGLFSLSTDYPIKKVVGVFLEEDFQKDHNFFTGGSFETTSIELTQELPFSDTRLVVDYVAMGVAVSTLRTIALAPEQETEIHAAVGKIRDSTSFCINNKRNISIKLTADKTEHNICVPGQYQSNIAAGVLIDGDPGSGSMVEWSVVGPGTIAPKFSAVKNSPIQGEAGRAVEVYEVATKNDISTVLGVWLLESGRSGTNFYATRQKRVPSFEENRITLGTDLPSDDAQVLIDYTARGIAQAVFTAAGQVGKATVTATLKDGTSANFSETIEIDIVNRCSDIANNPGAPPGGEKDCSGSAPSAATCSGASYPNAINQTVEECICKAESFGSPCPDSEEDCKDLCGKLYDRYGLDPLSCEQRVPDRERRTMEINLHKTIPPQQAKANKDCAGECDGDPDCIEECIKNHKDATVDRCTDRCLNHGLIIEPRQGSINCTGSKELKFTAKGGKKPYSWGANIGTLTVSEDGTEATLKPPQNSGSAVPGTAYRTGKWHRCNGGFNAMDTISYGCNDQVLIGCAKAVANGPCYNPTNCFFDGDGSGCENCDTVCPGRTPEDTPATDTFFGSTCLAERPCDANGALCDARTPSMISAGCKPCSIAFQGGGMVTVRDAQGLSATAVVTK